MAPLSVALGTLGPRYESGVTVYVSLPSVIACDAEAAIERTLGADETPAEQPVDVRDPAFRNGRAVGDHDDRRGLFEAGVGVGLRDHGIAEGLRESRVVVDTLQKIRER